MQTITSKLAVKYCLKFKTLLIFVISITSITGCDRNDNDLQRIIISDFKADELIKMHGGDEKSWRFTEVIVPSGYEDYPSLPNSSCVSDDVYTFTASATNESIEPVIISLGESPCFNEISDSESFNAQLLYVPYLLNDEEVVEVTLILEYSRYEEADNLTITSRTSYQLSELTEDRMVFSTGAVFVDDYTFAYVFEKL
ncbi:hypothetical protein [Winogradskyella aurantiaca]|uniref:hypothetical protein n=1 Tax=Winogradskyella aurantiaca TaxID=2219558 RepID=UPI000E1DD5C1|nr:hypothetical protein [Winogradskyella aurantiaca]